MTKGYIIAKSRHPVATGGTPIISWLPNQLMTVMKVISDVADKIDNSKLPDDLK